MSKAKKPPSIFRRLREPQVLNITRKDFEQSIERKIDVIIPFDLRIGAQAAKLGKTLAETAKGSKIGAACTMLLDEVLGAAVDGSDTGTAKAAKKSDSLLGKIGGIRGMIPSRKAKAAALED